MVRRILASKLGLRLLIGSVVLVVMLAIVPLVGAALADPCAQGETPTGCADVKLNDPALLADFYIGDTLAATGVNSARLNITPATSVKIEARNVRDGSPEFGDIYNYSNANTFAYVNAGQLRAYTLTPKKQYLKGFLALTCSVGNVQPDEAVVCRPSIDGVVQPDIAPGVKNTYALLPGKHAIHIDLVGDAAARWNKIANDHSATITAGRTASVTSKFVKRAFLRINLSEPGVTADLYLDGTLIASQVAAYDVWVVSSVSHKIEAKSITDPNAGDAYRWKDASANVWLNAGQQKTQTLKLTKEFLLGFLDLRCEPEGYKPTDVVNCNLDVDGKFVGVQKPAQDVRYNLSKGTHELTVTLSGDNAGKWEMIQIYKVTIKVGAATKSIAKFKPVAGSSPNLGYTATINGFDVETLKTIYKNGQKLGNNSRRFSLVGDSESAATEYLTDFDTGYYGLGDYQYLSTVLTQFRGSFGRKGQSVKVGYPASALLDPIWADPKFCRSDESPLACEIRIYKPAVMLILIRTHNADIGVNGAYHNQLRGIVKYCIDKGVIPVLSTAPYWYAPLPDVYGMNDTIRFVATEYKVPLWDLFVTLETLPNHGVRDEGGHTSMPPNGKVTFFQADTMSAGMTHRNLEALEVLHAIMTQVMK